MVPFIKTSYPASLMGYLMVLLFVFYPLSSKAQDDCSKTLQEARNLYDMGMIDEIPKMLAPCMEEGFTRSQRIEAYKLLILAYLFDDDQFDAEKTMFEFLKKFPEYQIMPNDPVEFIHLFESYRTTSEFSVGITAGFNLTNPRIIEPYSMHDMSNTELSNATGAGYQIGLGAGRYLGKRLMLNMDLQFAHHQYSFTDSSLVTDQYGDYTESVTFKEQLNKIALPVTATYEINKGKLLGYVRAGASVNYILSASGTPSSKSNTQPFNGESIDIRDYRNSFYFNAVLGLGVHYKIPRGFLSAGLRYNIGINSIVRSDKRFENAYLVSLFEHLDDKFTLNAFAFSVGYHFSFYNPKKQK